MTALLCRGSNRPIGRIPFPPGGKHPCEVCGQLCSVSEPSPKEKRDGQQATIAPHPPPE